MKNFAVIWILAAAIPVLGQNRVVNLNGNWKFRLGDRSVWASPDYNDSDWEEILVPKIWEDQGFHGYDGYAWYRITFDGKKLPRNKALYLNLGYIDDVDEAFMNGRKIGFAGYFPPYFSTAFRAKREYLIPQEFIEFDGRNVIAVRVFDNFGEGGFTGGDVGIFTADPNSAMLVDLRDMWSFKPGKTAIQNKDFDDWKRIMPSTPWESQGFNNLDGYAWYRKSFFVPADINDEDLVLMLGRIDDFDVTYLNGKIIGETGDDRPFGRSESYRETRVYTIPPGLLKKGDLNEVRVMVYDLGKEGGMVEGPVGITTRTKYYRYFR